MLQGNTAPGPRTYTVTISISTIPICIYLSPVLLVGYRVIFRIISFPTNVKLYVLGIQQI